MFSRVKDFIDSKIKTHDSLEMIKIIRACVLELQQTEMFIMCKNRIFSSLTESELVDINDLTIS